MIAQEPQVLVEGVAAGPDWDAILGLMRLEFLFLSWAHQISPHAHSGLL
jgi:hypothetical protein